MQQIASPKYEIYRFSKEIRANLVPLNRLNNLQGPLAIATDWFVIVCAIGLSELSLWFLPLTVLLIGSRQRALASLLHEGAHGVLCKSRHFNHILSKWGAGYPIFQVFDIYCISHVEGHHKHLGDPHHDPDFAHYIMTGLYDVRDRHDFFWKHFLKTVIFLNIPQYTKYLIVHRLGDVIKSRTALAQLVVVHLTLAILLSLTVGWYGYLLYWLLPFITAFQVIGWLSEISEHYDLFTKSHSSLTISRNRFPAWWERMFIGMHADNYHQTHHLFPLIPFWNIPKAHQILMADPNYAQHNRNVGGILSTPGNRRSVLSLIMQNIYEKPPSPKPHLSQASQTS